MEHTVSLKLNHVFRRLYGRGKSAVNPCLAVYCRKNNLGYSRLGLTVGVKLVLFCLLSELYLSNKVSSVCKHSRNL